MNSYNEMSFILFDEGNQNILFTGNIIDIILEINKAFKETYLEEILNIKLIHDIDSEDIVLVLKSIFAESELRLRNLSLIEIQSIINDFLRVSNIRFKIFILNEANFIYVYKNIVSDKKIDLDFEITNIDSWLYKNGFIDIYDYIDWFVKNTMKLDLENFIKYDKSYLIHNIRLIENCKRKLHILLKNTYELNNIITLKEAAEIMEVYPTSIKYLINKEVLRSRKSRGTLILVREDLYLYMKEKVYKKYIKTISKSEELLQKHGFNISDLKYFWSKDKYFLIFEKTDIPGIIQQKIVDLFNELSKELKSLFDKRIIQCENEIYRMGD